MSQLAERLHHPFRGRHTEQPVPLPARVEPILPYDVRYALQYKKSQFGREELTALLNSESYDLSAWMLGIKALGDNPDAQRKQLIRAVDHFKQDPALSDRGSFKAMTRDMIRRLPPELTVAGTKISQISHQGPKHWENLYRETAIAMREVGDQPVIIAHTALMGLPAFVGAFGDADMPLLVVNPHWIEDEDMSSCGYQIDLHADRAEKAVTMLPKDVPRPSRTSALLDDTVKTGKTFNLVTEFWQADHKETRVRTAALCHA